ncbi:hypothetical protein CYLTODRAFT_361661, partial [Cylindrobasidium torrendii FP15055 ss-10]
MAADSYLHPLLKIPSDAFDVLFPSQKLPVLDFCDFRLPPSAPRPKGKIDLSTFFSDNPTVLTNLATIQATPSPDSDTLDSLIEHIKTLFKNIPTDFDHRPAYYSILPVHLQHGIRHPLPLWVLTYWTELRTLRKDREMWIDGVNALRHMETAWKEDKKQQVIAEIFTTLGILPWGTTIAGFSNPEPMSVLARYLGERWLSDAHGHHALDLLR